MSDQPPRLQWPAWELYREMSDSDTLPVDPRTPSVLEPVDSGPVVPMVTEALEGLRTTKQGGGFTRILSERALADAQKLDADKRKGPLNGLTFAVKDLIAVQGYPLGAGSKVRAEADPEPRDASIVTSLSKAGAVLLGTTALHEFAFGVTGINAYEGTPQNPADPERIPGGSSSGSAVAVADGSVHLAVGTDTGGSVRVPAAMCGVVGYKPTYGSYSAGRVFPLAPTLDHVGFFARSVEILQRVQAALKGHSVSSVQPKKIGVIRSQWQQAEEEVRVRLSAVCANLEQDGCELFDMEGPDSEAVFLTSTSILLSEAAAVHQTGMLADAALYGEDVAHRIRKGLDLPATSYVNALASRKKITAQVGQQLSQVDCVLGPTLDIVAPRIEEADNAAIIPRIVSNTRLANLTGFPAISLPVGGAGLPVGIQLMGVDEVRLLGLAGYMEGQGLYSNI